MSNSDLILIGIVRVLCEQAQTLYEALAVVLSDQQARNVFRTLIQHRVATIQAISADHGPEQTKLDEEALVPESICEVNKLAKKEIAARHGEAAMRHLVERAKREVSFLRQEVKSTHSYVLRRRLSSFVATLQVDFDRLQRLALMRKSDSRGVKYE